MGGLLDQFLRSNLSKDAVAQLPQNYIVTTGVVQGNQPAMTAQITSKLTKREIREYPFKIKYRWFSLEGVSKNPLVLISGASDSTYKGANPNYGSKWFSSQFLTTIKNSAIPFAGFQKSNSDPKDFAIRGSAFIQITPDEVSGNTAYYNSYEKWLEDIQLMMKVTPDKSGTGGIEIRGTNDMLLRGPVMGSITKDRTSGVANFVKGDKSYIKLVGRKYYLLKPATESPKLMADLYRDQAQQRIPSHLRELEYYSEVTIS